MIDRRLALLLGGLLVSIMVWGSSAEVPAPARLFAALLVGVFPAVLMLQVPSAERAPGSIPRSSLYVSSIVTISSLAAASVLVGLLSGFDHRALGLRLPPTAAAIAWSVIATAAALGIAAMARWLGTAETAVVHYLVPRTARERALYVAVSLSAGVGEELIFRAFLVPSLLAGSGSVAVALALSSLAFGATHAHQRWAGALRATVLGLVLGVPFLVTGSIVPSMVAHTAVDLAAGLWLYRWLLGPQAD